MGTVSEVTMGVFTSLDNGTPSFFGTQWLGWIQWVYAGWQLLRKNALVVYIFSLPFHWLLARGRTVVIIGGDRDYDRTVVEADRETHNAKLVDLPVLERLHQWAKVKYKGFYYYVHQNALCEYLSIKQDIVGKPVFAVECRKITESVAVARKVSYDEGIESIFFRKGYCGKAPPYLILTCIDTVEISSRFWGVLSLVPIYLQIHNHSRISNLVSLVIIFLDLNKSWIYSAYLHVSQRIIDAIKVSVFGGRTPLYTFFSMMSDRWNYSDPNRKRSYYIHKGEKFLTVEVCKFRNSNDFYVNEEEPTFRQEKVGSKFQGYIDVQNYRGVYHWRKYNTLYLQLVTNKEILV